MPTLNEILGQYLGHLLEEGASAAYRRTVRWRLGQFLKEPHEELANRDRLIGFVTRLDVAEHLERMEGERGYAEGTMAGFVSTHKAFWRWCYTKGYTRLDIGEKLRRRSYAPQNRQPAPKEHVGAVAAVLEKYSYLDNRDWCCLRDATIVSLSLDSGARRRAIRNLRVDAVETALRAPETTPSGALYTARSFSKGKVAKLRFFEQTAALFRRLLSQLPAEARHVFLSLETHGPLHPDSFGGPFERVCEYAGVPTFRSHAVRKRNTIDVARVAGVRVAQEYAGHSDPQVTMEHYIMPADNEAGFAAAEVAARRRSRPSPDEDLDAMRRFFSVPDS